MTPIAEARWTPTAVRGLDAAVLGQAGRWTLVAIRRLGLYALVWMGRAEFVSADDHSRVTRVAEDLRSVCGAWMDEGDADARVLAVEPPEHDSMTPTNGADVARRSER